MTSVTILEAQMSVFQISMSHWLTVPVSLNPFKRANPSGGCSSAFSASETEAGKAHIGSSLLLTSFQRPVRWRRILCLQEKSNPFFLH